MINKKGEEYNLLRQKDSITESRGRTESPLQEKQTVEGGKKGGGREKGNSSQPVTISKRPLRTCGGEGALEGF